MNMKTNDSIKCEVKECEHHAEVVNYCTLDAIHVGTCECSPCSKEGTDCESFKAKAE